jgi:hypothetical protein
MREAASMPLWRFARARTRLFSVMVEVGKSFDCLTLGLMER